MAVQAWKAVLLKPDSSLRKHAHPVCQLVYNSVYQEAISADESGLICVWKVSHTYPHLGQQDACLASTGIRG